MTSGLAPLERLHRDIVYGVRMAARHPGFSVAAVLTLSLGIGAATTTYTLVDAIVLRPLPYDSPDRLVKIWASVAAAPIDNVSLLEFQSLRDQNHVFEGVAADDGTDADVALDRGVPEAANGAMVTPEWLATLGAQPVLGRGFQAEEGSPGRDGVVVLTHEYWKRRFESNPSAIGRTLWVDGRASQIVGILPPNVLRYGADFLRPLVEAEYPSRPGHRDLDVVARLRPGISVATAQAEVDVIADRLARAYPETNTGRRFSVMSLDKYYASVDPEAARGLLLMLGAVGIVLLIACVNVASLLIARTSVRGRECLIRAALGASRTRLMGQLLVENLILFLLAGACGTLLAWWFVDAIVALAVAQGYVPERLGISIDGRVLAFAIAVSVLAGSTFGLLPAWRASRVALEDGLRQSSLTLSGRRGRSRSVLVIAELTLSLVLLIGFGLVMRSFVGLYATAPGFVSSRLLETISEGGRSFTEAVGYWQSALARARTLPGVADAAVTSRPPLRGARAQRYLVDGAALAAGDEPAAGDILISAEYFRTLGIPVILGRPFTDTDTHASTPVVIISESLARRHFPGQNPLGRRLRLAERDPLTCCSAGAAVDGVWREIVGVVGDIRQGDLDEPLAATIYRPFTQIVEHDMYVMLKVRTEADMARVAPAFAAEMRAAHPGSRWLDLRSTERAIDSSGSVQRRRFVLILLGVFAVLAASVAGAGLYGVMAYFVVERRHEIAVRVALGASRANVVGQVLREAVRLAAIGLALGALAGHFLTRYISSLLFNVSANDPLTYGIVCLVLAAIAALASYVPARHAASIDPMLAFKEP